jgi:hypothetical protein
MVRYLALDGVDQVLDYRLMKARIGFAVSSYAHAT